jgi:hypothetical protein
MATSTTGAPAKRGSILSAIGWMFLLELLLFWLPVVGSLIAGFVGGRKAGSLSSAVTAVILPIVFFSLLLGMIATALVAIPLVGAFAGLGGFVFAIAHVGPLLLGAIVGGLASTSHRGSPTAP